MKSIQRILALSVLAVSAAAPNVASAALFSYPGPAAFDVDTPFPSTVDLVVVDSTIIQDLDVPYFLSAGFGSDNTVTLTHVDTGTTVTLINSDGGAGSFASLNVTFDDEGFAPAQSLSAFDGETVGGTWRLTFVDPTGFTFEGDDLVSWGISGTSLALVPEPATATLGLIAFGGMMLRRRRIA